MKTIAKSQKFSLNQTLDEVSYQYVHANFKFDSCNDGLVGMNAYGTSEWIKFFNSGKAAYSNTGSVKDVVEFNSHQDAVDFIRVK